MSEREERLLHEGHVGQTGEEMPGGGPSGGDVHDPRSKDRVVTSSGTAPTGGTPVGGASDRTIPDRSVRSAASAEGGITSARSKDDGVQGDVTRQRETGASDTADLSPQ